MQYEVYARTDQGRVRQNNEDNFFVSGTIREDVNQGRAETGGVFTQNRLLFAVCDGMGGVELGEVASLAAVKVLAVDESVDMRTEARRNVNAGNRAVLEKQTALAVKRMGTTIAAFAIDADKGLAYNLGDSRVYHFRDALRQMTSDHSMANYLVQIGILKPEQAKTGINKNSITKYLGMDSDCELEPYFSEEVELQSGDRILLCSDGLCNMVSDEQLGDILGSGKDCRAICNELVDTALSAGGTDNITAVVIRAL